MNTLTLIKKQIDKAAALHDAQINITKYRGVDCQVHQASEETHGTYCYRGRTYVKWETYFKFAERVNYPLFFYTYVKMKQMYTKLPKLL